VPSGLPDPAPGTTKSVGIGASNKTPPCASHRLLPLQASLFSQTFVTGAVGVRMRTSTSVVIPEAVGFLMLPGTYTAFAPIGRFQMLSREKGHSVALRPVADADETDEASCADGAAARVANEAARRSPIRTSAGTSAELGLRFGGKRNERRMRVAQVCGMGVTIRGGVVTSSSVYSGACTSIESGSREAEHDRSRFDT